MANPFWRSVIAIALGAVPGAISRYWIGETIVSAIGQEFSLLATFFVNTTGCFIIGLFYTLTEKKFPRLPPEFTLAIATGFCGAYTTFSAYALETITELDKGNDRVALLYWLGSMVVGTIALQAGVILGNLTSQD